MRPLVYDFGQLQQVTEDDYIRQIVHDHVKKHESLRKKNAAIVAAIVPVITGVLATSQAYMRGKKVVSCKSSSIMFSYKDILCIRMNAAL